MKVAFTSYSASRKFCGIFNSQLYLAHNLTAIPGTEVDVFSLEDEFSKEDSSNWAPLVPQYFSSHGPKSFGYAPALKAALLESRSELVHLHGLWTYASVATTAWSRITGRPHLISPHGMLDPWALNNSAWKKRVARTLFEDSNLQHAACIHALNVGELNAIRSLGFSIPVCVIPVGVDLQNSAVTLDPPWSTQLIDSRKRLLYFGRLHPKKGLVNLVNAWAKIHRSDSQVGSQWCLVIAGRDQVGHETILKQLVKQHGIQQSVIFTGALSEFQKEAAYQNCDAFVLPSFGEGLPMVVLEAWAHGKPVLTTPECNLPEGFTANAAIRIEPNAESIANGLHQLFRLPSSDLRSLGKNGRQLVAEKFTWPKVAGEMRSVYDWMLGTGPKPGCVV